MIVAPLASLAVTLSENVCVAPSAAATIGLGESVMLETTPPSVMLRLFAVPAVIAALTLVVASAEPIALVD